MPQPGRFSNITVVNPQHDPRTAALKYRPEYCQTIRDLAQEGKFPETWCATIGVTTNTLYVWANNFPEFEEAVHISWHILHHYWTEKLVQVKTGFGETPPTVILEIMRKRFPKTWGKNPVNTHENFTNRNDPDVQEQSARISKHSDEDIAKRIADLTKRRAHDGTGRRTDEGS